MSSATNATIVEERAAALREELQRWLKLAKQIEQHADKFKDATSLLLMQRILASARRMFEDIIAPKTARDYPIMPYVESQEISLPSFTMPGEGIPVTAKPGGDHLPDPAFIRNA